ncbi:hypothetical protein [Alicyclobacillus acidoterrestris]|uniref:Uncharacterized protein n=1 Tax=Alicyclobacillus acidoterrestris (strain ATCC 49025 / DSM 3922 / CIP 106132 / NCIMB 13137 / GD3B) TaxID=1356854 RepID=T0BTN8_ALIAG|nr:hypothetical protein [Alicyclobacillus acidoterrestris]EPZ43835.1 hypothetical protein N007_12010 [Alicyclobacillus acidoterrestris ATCC 49025]UNO49033.1 hypothetical protein K1I37_00200 [Alicyclobacillus acidoterrestris]
MATQQLSANDQFVLSALKRNYPMPQVPVQYAGQVVDIELDSVPGWARAINLTCLLNVDITVASGGSAPSMSPFAPYNIFSAVEVSLGGGPFQRVNGLFYYLREMISTKQDPKNRPATDPSYVSGTTYSVPPIQAAAGSTETNTWRFGLKIPLEMQHGSVVGLLPLGSASTRCKVRLTLASQLWSNDQYMSPLYGGSGVSAQITPTAASWVAPNIKYFTAPAVSGGGTLPTPTIGQILNVQENTVSFVGAGSLTPCKFPNPFTYLRLYHIVIDGTGAPNSSGVTNFELDLTPGYPQFNYSTPASLQDYFEEMLDLYKNPLKTGVFIFDLWSGNDPTNPNDTQAINGATFSSLQTQIAVSASTSVASPAKIVTYAEALSPVGF